MIDRIAQSMPVGRNKFNFWSQKAVSMAKAMRKLQKGIRRFEMGWPVQHVLKYANRIIPGLEVDKRGLEIPEKLGQRSLQQFLGGVRCKIVSLNRSLQGRK